MATEAQINANRTNAQKSTGPRTPEGKAVVSRNAVTHGFLARETVIQGEDPGEFEFYRDRMLGDLAPVGDGELEMAERAVGLAWRLRRAERLQTEAFDALYEKMATGSPAGDTPQRVPDAAGGAGIGDDRLLGRMLVEDFGNARVLDQLLLYERRIESSLYRTLRELREQKRVRQSQPVAQSCGAGLSSASARRGAGSRRVGSPSVAWVWGPRRDIAVGGILPARESSAGCRCHQAPRAGRPCYGDAWRYNAPVGAGNRAKQSQSRPTRAPTGFPATGGQGTTCRERNLTKQTQFAPEPMKRRFWRQEKGRSVPAPGGSGKQSQFPGAIPASLSAVRRVA